MKIYGLVLLMILAHTVWAADDKGNYAIWGAGAKSCQGYNVARAANEDAKFKDYLMGYLTSYNHMTEKTYSISSQMSLDEVMTWIDEQCELKPMISFEEVLTNFLAEHYEKRMKYPAGGGFR